jgi:hypothetical protein
MASKKKIKSSKLPGAVRPIKKPVLRVVETKVEPASGNFDVQSSGVVRLQDVRLAPELKAQVVQPALTQAVNQTDERERAREERRARKQADMEERRRRRTESNATSQAPLPASELPVNEAKTDVAGHIRVAIPEALKYKLLYCESEYKKFSEPIRLALKQAAQARLVADIAKAIKEDSKCKDAAFKMEACVNEILDSIRTQLPDGYAATFVATEDGVVICKPSPEMVGRRFKLA